MRFLLDTHVFLWAMIDDPQLTDVARDLLEDTRHTLLVSPASYWECAIKVSTGKLELSTDFATLWIDGTTLQGIGILNVAIEHAALVSNLPFHHRDPFDRMLVAQALAEGVPLISADPHLDAYGVDRRW